MRVRLFRLAETIQQECMANQTAIYSFKDVTEAEANLNAGHFKYIS